MKASHMKKKHKNKYAIIYIFIILLITTFILTAKYISLLTGESTGVVARFDVNYEIENTNTLQINCNDDTIQSQTKKITLTNNSEVSVYATINLKIQNENNDMVEMPEYTSLSLYSEDGTEISKEEESTNSSIVYKVPLDMQTTKNVIVKLEVDENNKNDIEQLNANVNVKVTFSQID